MALTEVMWYRLSAHDDVEMVVTLQILERMVEYGWTEFQSVRDGDIVIVKANTEAGHG